MINIKRNMLKREKNGKNKNQQMKRGSQKRRGINITREVKKAKGEKRAKR